MQADTSSIQAAQIEVMTFIEHLFCNVYKMEANTNTKENILEEISNRYKLFQYCFVINKPIDPWKKCSDNHCFLTVVTRSQYG